MTNRATLHSVTTSARAAMGGTIALVARTARHRLGSARDQRWSRITTTLGTLGRTSPPHTTTLTPYYDTGDAYRAMWAAVDGAEKRVVWHTFICDDDAVGRITFDKLTAARKRGVEVQLLYDSGGTYAQSRRRLTAGLRAAGGDVINYRPFLGHLWGYIAAGLTGRGFDWRRSPVLRNHRKVVLVDDRVGFIGGLNIGNDYACKTAGGNGRFRDTMCKVEGPSVAHLIEVCNDTVHKQDFSRPHPSLAQRWRQWARKAAPMRLRARVYAAPQIRRATRLLRRQLKKAERIGNRAATEVSRRADNETGSTTRRQRVRRAISAFLHRREALKQAALSARADGQSVRPRTKTRGVSTRGRLALRRARARLQTVLRRAHETTVALAASADGGVSKDSGERRVSSLLFAVPARVWRRRRRSDTCPTDDPDVDVAVARLQEQLRNKTNTPPVTTHNTLQGDQTQDYDPLTEGIDPQRSSTVGSAQVLMCNPHTRDWSLQRALWMVTREAHRRVWVTTPYFLPHAHLFHAVLAAGKRGIDVRIVVGNATTTDPWFMWYTSKYVQHKLLAAGVRLYEFDGGQIMHAKTVVVDRRWACVGSYNWDVLSNKLLEASIAGYDRRFARTMEEHFLKDVARSRRVTEDDLAQRSVLVRLACCFFYHGVRLMEAISFIGYKDKDLHSSFAVPVEEELIPRSPRTGPEEQPSHPTAAEQRASGR